jgi:hypothetical protein
VSVREAVRVDWRDSLSTAADVALIGIAVTVAAAPLVTAGAAVRTGSVAVWHVIGGGSRATVGELWAVFRRSLLPGLAATVVVLAAAGLLVVDLVILSSGRVPGAPVALVLTGGLAAVGATLVALTVVRLGREPECGWVAAARWAGRTARHFPGTAVAVAFALVLAAVLAVLVPATAPLLVGFALFALHVLTRRAP